MQMQDSETQRLINQNMREYFDPMVKHHLNVVSLNSGNTLEHELLKTEICYKLKREGRTFITEGVLLSGDRPDITVLDLENPIAYEIVHSETFASIKNKKFVFRESKCF